MENKKIVQKLKLHASLLELHGENPFKIRSYHNANFHIEKMSEPLAKLSIKQLEKLQGIGKALAEKICSLNTNGSFKQLDEYLRKTPRGVVNMLDISGLGIKKVKVLWEESGIDSIDKLWEACENNEIMAIKGFGEKMQENIKQALLFRKINSSRFHYRDAEIYAQTLETFLTTNFPQSSLTGEFRRKTKIINQITALVTSENIDDFFEVLAKADFLDKDEAKTGLFAWRGKFKDSKLKVEIFWTQAETFTKQLFIHSADEKHLAFVPESQTQNLLTIAQEQAFQTETELYEKVNLPYILPEMREGFFEFELAKILKVEDLLKTEDLTGIFHAHSTYSDGKNTLKEMAEACQVRNYQYLGITDHSQSSFYANGLSVGRLYEQWKEIDELNTVLAPFHIFKGIEVDILSDGSLDYEKDILAKFDFTVASVHAGLKMDKEKATARLIKAIENPYTTMLGHATGRLLLKREGYPLDFEKVIEACAKNKVIIEINASPWRLDLDWYWVKYALDKGVEISINPDAHAIAGIDEVKYGVFMGRKAGLTKDQTFNTKSLEEIKQYFGK